MALTGNYLYLMASVGYYRWELEDLLTHWRGRAAAHGYTNSFRFSHWGKRNTKLKTAVYPGDLIQPSAKTTAKKKGKKKVNTRGDSETLAAAHEDDPTDVDGWHGLHQMSPEVENPLPFSNSLHMEQNRHNETVSTSRPRPKPRVDTGESIEIDQATMERLRSSGYPIQVPLNGPNDSNEPKYLVPLAAVLALHPSMQNKISALAVPRPQNPQIDPTLLNDEHTTIEQPVHASHIDGESRRITMTSDRLAVAEAEAFSVGGKRI